MSIQRDEGWLDPRAADGMLALAIADLAKDPDKTPPFRAFLQIMEYVLPTLPDFWQVTLLDVGCGVGHYAVLCDRHLSGKVFYQGCDISPHMIDRARNLAGDRFFLADALSLKLRADIILASSLIEVCPNWEEVLAHLIKLAHFWLILARVRVWKDADHPTTIRTYETIYSTTTTEVVHNRDELFGVIARANGHVKLTVPYQIDPEFYLCSLAILAPDPGESLSRACECGINVG